MRRIWRMGRICEVDVNSAASLARLSQEERNKVTAYLNGYAAVGSVYQGTHRFTFLGDDPIHLAHAPALDAPVAQGKFYLRLDDLQDSSQGFVRPASAPTRRNS